MQKIWTLNVEPISKLIMLFISKHGEQELSYSDIANSCGLSRKTVIVHIKKLCDSGLIIKKTGYEVDGSALPNSYKVV
jgi:DNA-binding Lrp family transcriptional regulator